jgi:hypothetical protein
MSVSEEELAKKLKLVKSLASKRIDEILKKRTAVKQQESGITFINSLLGWLKK